MRVASPLTVRILTKNIRYATKNPTLGERPWDERLPYLINELHYSTLHCSESFICLQEALYSQIINILDQLNNGGKDDWTFVGVGRDDGSQAGEFSPVLYRPAVWRLEHFQTKWLSESQDKPSLGWDAACRRILTVCIFSHRSTGEQVVACNTHLDHKGHVARQRSAEIILAQVEKFSMHNLGLNLPIFLAGDFNSEPDQEAYLAMTSGSSPLNDLHELLPREQRYGDDNTFSGFDSGTRRKRIDFLFLNQKTASGGRWRLLGYTTLPNRFEDRIYNSGQYSPRLAVRLPGQVAS